MNADSIFIRKFGPLEDVSLDLDGNIILVGPQAGGKSTLAKLIYIYRLIPDLILNPFDDYIEQWLGGYVVNENELDEESLVSFLKKTISETFSSVFGVDYSVNDFYISFNINRKSAFEFYKAPYGVELKVAAQVVDVFNGMIALLKSQMDYYKANGLENSFTPEVSDFYSKNPLLLQHVKIVAAKGAVSHKLGSILWLNNENLYVPAGRSAYSAFSSLLNNEGEQVDGLLIGFLKKIVSISKNTASFQDFYNKYKPSKNEKHNVLERILDSINISEKLLRGKFIQTNGDLYIANDKSKVKINFASSGQQEAIWILLICLEQMTIKNNLFMVLEEPEAHLFPNAQYEILKVISNLINLKGNLKVEDRNSNEASQIIITTHSPYVLTSINCMLLGKSSGLDSKLKNAILPEKYWLDPKLIRAFHVDGKVNSIMDEELGIIKVEYIDQISEELNDIQYKLIGGGDDL